MMFVKFPNNTTYYNINNIIKIENYIHNSLNGTLITFSENNITEDSCELYLVNIIADEIVSYINKQLHDNNFNNKFERLLNE